MSRPKLLRKTFPEKLFRDVILPSRWFAVAVLCVAAGLIIVMFGAHLAIAITVLVG